MPAATGNGAAAHEEAGERLRARGSPGHCSYVMLALAAPALAQKPPMAHSSHAVEPTLELNLPTGHCEQFVLLGLAAYCPARHGKHTAPVALSAYLPLSHATQRVAAHVVALVLVRSGKDES